jgi:non-heme Fe2+,alpha-ketoglutarate-dependent halogenase
MEFLPGSHERGQLPHTAGVVAHSVNRARQAVDGVVGDTPAVHAPLRAGEFSLHHTLILHRSQPNRSLGRRIGLGISYIPTHVQHVSARVKAPAMLVRGVDAFGHFELEPVPCGDFDDVALDPMKA